MKRITLFLFIITFSILTIGSANQTVFVDPTAGSCDADGGNTGNGTCTINTVSAFAKTETLTMTATSAGPGAIFSVVGSTSGTLGSVVSGSPSFVLNENGFPMLEFTLSDGAATYVIGDSFEVGLTAGTELKQDTFDLFDLEQVCLNDCDTGSNTLTALNLKATGTPSADGHIESNGDVISRRNLLLEQLFGVASTNLSADGSIANLTVNRSVTNFTSASAKTLHGIGAGLPSDIPNAGAILWINNDGGNLTIANQSASAIADANKIVTGTGQDLLIEGQGSLSLTYDRSISRWRVVSVVNDDLFNNVKLTGSQTIAGEKTFTDNLTVSGTSTLTGNVTSNGNTTTLERLTNGTALLELKVNDTTTAQNALIRIKGRTSTSGAVISRLSWILGPDSDSREVSSWDVLRSNTSVGNSAAGGIIRLRTAQTDGTLTEGLRIDQNQNVSVPNGDLTVSGDTIISSDAPSTASDACTAGKITWSSDHVYICIATDTWKRAALSTW